MRTPNGMARSRGVLAGRVFAAALTSVALAIACPPPLAAQDPPESLPSAPSEPPGEAVGHSFFPLPFLFYQPETGLGGGGGLLHTYRPAPAARANTDQLLVVITTKSQYSIALVTSSYLRGGRWMIAGELGGSRFPDLFYGVGNETRAGDEESFTLDRAGGVVDVRRGLSGSVFLGPSVAYWWSDPHGFDEGGRLESGTIGGGEGGVVAGLGASLLSERRNHTLTPTRGTYLAGGVRVYDPAVGSDYAFTRYELDARAYRPVREGRVLAVQVIATGQTGDPPFFELARLGGAAVLRGSYDGRYRDRNRLFAQAEYRFHAWRRLGGAVFAGAGQVARDWDDLRLDGVHASYGAGLRFLVSSAENVNVRVDFGVAGGESGLYFGFAEAF